MEIELNGKTYPIKMKLLAVKMYRELTGFNLLGGHDLTDIFGNGGKGDNPKYPDPDRIAAFVYSLIRNGGSEITLQEVAQHFELSDVETGKKLASVYYKELYGVSIEELNAQEKNQPAPEKAGA